MPQQSIRRRNLRTCIAAAVLCLLVEGCADVQPLDYTKLQLGTTTRQDVIAQVGEPSKGLQLATVALAPTLYAQNPRIFQPKTDTVNGRCEMDRYFQAHPGNLTVMEVTYCNNVLVKYYFLPSTLETAPDSAKVGRIRIGGTTTSELLELLGPPDSASLTAATINKLAGDTLFGPSGKILLAGEADAGFKQLTWGILARHGLVIVTLNANGIVSDVYQGN